MFLERLIEKNPGLALAAIEGHQSGAILARIHRLGTCSSA
jgi:hypothetical protein